jgi:hypothetical protein
MRIELSDPSHCPALRDYFLGLGAVADLEGTGTVNVSFPNQPVNADESIEAYLRSWVDANRVAATVVPLLRQTKAPTGVQNARPDLPPRLGDLLVAKGFITAEQLAFAVVEARQQGEMLGRLLLRYEWVFESELARTLAEQWGLPYLNLQSIGVNRDVVQLLPREIGARAAAIPVRPLDGATQVAFADPTDPAALAAVREHIPNVVPAVAELSDIEDAWRSAAPAPEPRTEPATAPAATETRPKIGELFVQKGLLSRSDLEDALAIQKTSGKRLGEILVERGLIDRLHLASMLTTQWSAQRDAERAPENATSQTAAGVDEISPNGAASDGAAAEATTSAGSADPPSIDAASLAALAEAVADVTATVARLREQVEALVARASQGVSP